MNEVEMIPVISTTVESIGYDADNGELHVRFLKGSRLYIYSGVPQVMFDEFLVAESKGQFLDRQVKKGGFPYRKG